MAPVDLSPATIAVIAVFICILVALLIILFAYYLEQQIVSQWVSVQRCRWTGFWGSLFCLLVWVLYVIEVIFFILVCILIPVFIVMNIWALAVVI